MIRIIAVLIIVLSADVFAQEKSPDEVYDERIEDARDAYRVAIAKQIRQANFVEVVLLRFDDLREIDLAEDDEERFVVAPYEATTGVITERRLNHAESEELLLALADQVEKAEHKGGALCHFPVHGVRVYSGKPGVEPFESELVYSGTFCWACGNFGFSYPDGADWLDTDDRLKAVFSKLLPIPKEEVDRFKKQYPSATEREQDDAGDSSAAPTLNL